MCSNLSMGKESSSIRTCWNKKKQCRFDHSNEVYSLIFAVPVMYARVSETGSASLRSFLLLDFSFQHDLFHLK